MIKSHNTLSLNLPICAKALIVLRVIIITIFLGTVLMFQSQMEKSYPIFPITMIIVAVYILTIIYGFSFRFINDLRLFCYVQIICDLIIETIVIFNTGGIESVFTFLYILSIISASIILEKPGNYLIALMAGVCYGAVAYFEFIKIIHPISLISNTPQGIYYYSYKVFLNTSVFFLVGYLSGYLGENWRTTGKKLEEKSENLVELQAFHENILKSMSSGLITTDLNKIITSFNSAAEDITSYKSLEVVGSLLNSFLNFLDPDLLPDTLSSAMGNYKNTFRSEGYFVKKDKKKIYIGLSIASLKDDENIIKGFIITFQDLTNMKEMEEKVARAERFAAIGHISAGIAHEIRNPLASMSGSIQVLKDELKLNGSNKQLMEIVLNETDRLNSIITQFLNYASPNQVKLEECNISQLISDILTLLKNSKDYNDNIIIKTKIEDNIIIQVDTAQMKQVLINLCLNSFHAISGGGNFFVSTRLEKNGGRDMSKKYLKMNFSDDGYGMSKETLNRVFDPFYTTKDKGTGLGLAVVYRIIEKHQGSITIKSSEGMGTSIDITLPYI